MPLYKHFAGKHDHDFVRDTKVTILEKTAKDLHQYVGQTERTLQERMGGHRQATKTKINLPLYKHFAGKHDHDFVRDTKVTILEKTAKDLLLTREAHWILTLDTVYPKGLNSRYDKQPSTS